MTSPTEPPATATDDAPAPVDHNEVFRRCRELVDVSLQLKALDVSVERLKVKRRLLEAYLIDCFTNEPQLNRMTVNGYTVSLRKTLWAKCDDKEKGYDALIAAGLGDYATRGFNSQSVSALFREWEENEEPPPAELDGVITTTDTYNIGVTSSTTRRAAKKKSPTAKHET